MRGRLTSQAIARPQATNLGRLGYSSISGMSWMVTSVTARIALRVRSDHISGHRAGGFSSSPFPLFKPEVGIIVRRFFDSGSYIDDGHGRFPDWATMQAANTSERLEIPILAILG
jgi:hypothetical protein